MVTPCTHPVGRPEMCSLRWARAVSQQFAIVALIVAPGCSESAGDALVTADTTTQSDTAADTADVAPDIATDAHPGDTHIIPGCDKGAPTPSGCPSTMFCDQKGCDDRATGICMPTPTDCPRDGAEVCGCDGVTYASDCQRQVAGSALAHDGACGVEGCPGGCGGGQYCEVASCLPGSPGICTALPTTGCDHATPRCGCDGTTYADDCLRAQAGVGKAHDDACAPQSCGVSAQVATCPGDQFCDPICGPPGLPPIEPPLLGNCATVPTDVCPAAHGLPVCGCDGKDYPSDCERLQAHVGKRFNGSCTPQPCPGSSGGQCSGATVCEHRTCDAGAPGICAGIPVDGCAGPGAGLECGCDGTTYPSYCERLLAGVAFDHFGSCGGPGVCGDFAACDEGQSCDVHGCEPRTSGACVPAACEPGGSQVCGCDDKTYPDDCARLKAGVAQAEPNKCTSRGCGNSPGSNTCPEGWVCVLAECTSGSGFFAGTCVEQAIDCGDDAAPVCGCDHHTYDSACALAAAGVHKAPAGFCSSP